MGASAPSAETVNAQKRAQMTSDECIPADHGTEAQKPTRDHSAGRWFRQGGPERREEYGVRAACCRFRGMPTDRDAGRFESGSKLHALHTLRDVRGCHAEHSRLKSCATRLVERAGVRDILSFFFITLEEYSQFSCSNPGAFDDVCQHLAHG